MAGLNTSLSVASGALAAAQAAIDVTNNNIANANTPGYSREIVNLSSLTSIQSGNVALGNGVTSLGVTSVRDQLLTLRIQQQTSQQTSASAQSGALASVQTYFSDSSGTVGSALSSFFSSLSGLSATPTSSAARQTVISNAQSVVSSFQSTSQGLTSTQTGLNLQISGSVTQINSLTAQIAALNPQIAQRTNAGQDPSVLADQRSQLEQKLSTLTSISIATSAEGDTITTGNGTTLVAASQSFPLATSVGSNGLTQVLDPQGNAITNTLTGGQLGGLIQVRDVTIPGFLAQLDSLANGFATALNTAQAGGFDLSGASGATLFTLPAGVSGSAAQIGLNLSDGSKLAISSSAAATAGSGNLSAFTAAQTQPLPSGASLTDSFAGLVAAVGTAAAQANTDATALQSSLTQLTNQQGAVSGVSLDEESANLVRYQQSYQAAAEVISVIRSLFNSTLSILPASGGF